MGVVGVLGVVSFLIGVRVAGAGAAGRAAALEPGLRALLEGVVGCFRIAISALPRDRQLGLLSRG